MLTGQLLPYQAAPVRQFLARGSLLLAMEPGMGKTVIAIAAAEKLRAAGEASCCLCVVPAALKYQWAQRIAEFTDLPACQVRAGREMITVPAPPGCVLIDGSQDQRDRQYAAVSPATRYVILGYPNVLSDWAPVSAFPWDFVLLDEITAIKNPGSDISQAVRAAFQVPWRLGLTGTPVENKPEELYSIMDWVAPGFLGGPLAFDRAFIKRGAKGDVIRYRNLPVLHRQLQPVMHRRKRSDPDAAPFFPREDEDSWAVPLPAPLREVYRALAADLLEALASLRRTGRAFDVSAAYRGGRADEGTAVGRVAARMQAMEMLTCHPGLITASAADYRASQRARRRGQEKKVWPGSRWCSEITQSGIISTSAALCTPKLDYLAARCREITRDPATKILVYTKYTRMLPFIAEALESGGMASVRYSGAMTTVKKTESIARFTASPHIRAFVSSHAGAYGCDMHMASHLINYDIPWSGGKALQISGRHVRASNNNRIIYIRHLLAQGTLDERKLAQVRFKNRIASAIVDGHGADSQGRIENNIGTLAGFLGDLLHA